MTSEQRAPFHFSPRPNRAHEIRWREWGADAFEEAKREDKPVLLGISAVWCHWCHVMDETSYSDDEVIRLLNERFVPVRVDNDQRPDVNARYNMGGWPTTAFLSPDGEVLAGMTYVPPDQMRQVVDQLSTYYQENRDELARKVEELRERRQQAMASAAPGELSDKIVDDVLAAIRNAYDPVYGGFGIQPKFPHTDTIDLLLYLHLRRDDPDLLHMARKTLEQMAAGGVFDHVWGGFFRYATNRDWSVPHFEKMLEDNALLLHNFLRLFRITGDPKHGAVASRVIDYLDGWLSDEQTGAFYGSQDADEEFYPLDAYERAKREAPYVDRTVYTSWNALACSAHCEASWTLGRPELLTRARAALDWLWDHLHRPGEGMYRYFDGDHHQPGLLGDQVYTALALLDAYEASTEPAYLDRALELASLLEERFQDREHGGFFDVWQGHESLGRLDLPNKPVGENAAGAQLFLRLERYTHERRFQDIAGRTLAAFAGQQDALGHFAAAYARAVDSYLHPQADIKIVAAPEQLEMFFRATLRLRVPDRTVQALDPVRDAGRLAALGFPLEPNPVAYVCYGTICSPPVRTLEELDATIAHMREQGESGAEVSPVASAGKADPEKPD